MMCGPSRTIPQGFAFQGFGDSKTPLTLIQDSQMSKTLFDDNQAVRDEAFHGYHNETNMRHCVQHNYHDHANDDDAIYLEEPIISKGGVAVPFPMKLHNMLDHIDLFEPELSNIVRWQPHGRCFLVKNPKEFASNVLPRFFDQRKYASFQRQLNLYGFNRITAGPDKGSYYHELFLRSKKILCRGIHRMKIKGTGTRMAGNPEQEPNFYAMDSMPSSSSAQKRLKPDPVSSSDDKDCRTLRYAEREVVTPPTPDYPSSVQEEMPPLQLSTESNPSPNSVLLPPEIEPQISSSTDNVASITLSSLIKRDDETDHSSSSSDLSFVFGDMPFHSIDTTKPHHGRRKSFMDLIVPDQSSPTSAPRIDGDDNFDTDLENFLDFGLKDLSDHEMSELLDKIVNQDVCVL